MIACVTLLRPLMGLMLGLAVLMSYFTEPFDTRAAGHKPKCVAACPGKDFSALAGTPNAGPRYREALPRMLY